MAWGRLKEGDKTVTEGGGCVCHSWTTFPLWCKNWLSHSPTLPSPCAGRLNQHLSRSCQAGTWGTAAHQQLRVTVPSKGKEQDTNVRTPKSQISFSQKEWVMLYLVWASTCRREWNQMVNQGRDKHFRTAHVRTALENGSIPYKPGAIKGNTETQ